MVHGYVHAAYLYIYMYRYKYICIVYVDVSVYKHGFWNADAGVSFRDADAQLCEEGHARKKILVALSVKNLPPHHPLPMVIIL